MSRRWSLRRRLTLSFAATTGLLAFAVAGVAALYLRVAVRAAIDALVREEIEELALRLPSGDVDESVFASIVAELEDQHPANPLAARLVIGDGVAFEAGSVELLLGLDERSSAGSEVLRADHSRHFATAVLGGDRRLMIVVDGAAQRALLGQFAAAALVLGVIGTALGLAFGAVAARFASDMLSRVAEGARAVRSSADADAFDFPDAPVELDRLARALGEMLSGLHRRQERARLFAAGLGHELGAPVQNLLAESEIALLRERTPDEYREALRRQRDELHDLSRALRNLVAFVALESPAAARADERFDLTADVARRIERERRRGEPRSVTVVLEARSPVVVHGDRDAIGLAVQNLLTNAIDWSPIGGRVTIGIDTDGAWARVVVDDQGAGVPEAERERVFGALLEGRGAPDRRRGFGLGLAITRGVARTHGGDVTIQSSPDGGARFVLTLPLGGHGG